MAERRQVKRAFRGENHAPPASTFLRGLTFGALVGAAVAGSVLLGRRRRRGSPPEAFERSPDRERGSRD